MRKLILSILFLALLGFEADAKKDWDVEINIYHPQGAPIIISKVESHWQDYRPPVYNQYGWRLKKELLPGIWCKTYFEVPSKENEGKEIIAIKYCIWYFNAFDELLGAYYAYSKGKYKPGKKYVDEWLTQDERLGPTHYRTVIFPYEIRFSDMSWWRADQEEVLCWFGEIMDWEIEKFKREELFPKDKFGIERESEL